MQHYNKYYVDNAEIQDVMDALKTLRQKRLLSKFAKSVGVSQSAMSALVLGERHLSRCTLTVYNKIVSNIDTFLEEYEEN